MRKEIENLIKEVEQKKSNIKDYLLFDKHEKASYFGRGAIQGLDFCIEELKKILNEAVVCGSERNQTMCKRVIICSQEVTEVAQYCLTCKKEFDFFGKEISS